jgi:rSAM/selenodomain-associated transferase 2
MRISIIIPVLDEEENLGAAIDSTRSGSTAEVIVVDGGSRDGSIQVATKFGATVIASPAGRAKQMNSGALVSRGDTLLFLHADTRLPPGFDQHVDRLLTRPGTAAGAFLLAVDSRIRALRLIERAANWRSLVLQMPYGDQAIFLRTVLFQEMGGYPDLPLMEDYEMMRRLRRLGRIAIAPVPVLTSSRRWRERGIWRTTLRNRMAILAYLLHVDPQAIARWYHGAGKTSNFNR